MHLSEAHIQDLEKRLGSHVLLKEEWRRESYASDELKRPFLPDLVVEPETVEQIQELLRWANRNGIPVTPRGAGTGLSGGALCVHGGVLLSMQRFNRILEVDRVNQFAVVEPGVINLDLQRAAEEVGLFYPPDPASWDSSSLGGNVAEDAGGPRCVKYGVTRNYVMQLEAVLPCGEFVVCGTRTRKGVVGYSLRDLLIGSEGTLGIVTKMVLRLLPKPKSILTLLALLPDAESAGKITTALSRERIVPCALEFMDDHALDLVREDLPLSLPAECRCLLLIELDGETELIERDAQTLDRLSTEAGAVDLLLADSREKRERLWDIRRRLSPTTRERFRQKLSEDVAIPLDRIVEFLKQSRRVGEEESLTVLSYGHMGDGNLHTNILGKDGGQGEWTRMRRAMKRIFQLALDLGGTMSAEHGIGCWKQPFISMELSRESLELQKAIKRLFDPKNILNPGKIFDWPDSKELI